MKALDVSNQRFGRLTALRRIVRSDSPETKWRCRCDCGSVVAVSIASLRNGKTASCGCLRRETAAITAKNKTTHGMNGTPTYRCWVAMRHRCENSKNPAWPRYGGRGIKVCERWQKFENFLADMGERPEDTSIDRHPNNDGDYEPGNCRWANFFEQNNNRRSSVLITARGETMSIRQWSRRTGISHGTISYRIENGWTAERAISKMDGRRR